MRALIAAPLCLIAAYPLSAQAPEGYYRYPTASYEGPVEVYTMPIAGGLPTRRTYDGSSAQVVGWTPDGKLLYATRRYSTLPNHQMVHLKPPLARGIICVRSLGKVRASR